MPERTAPAPASDTLSDANTPITAELAAGGNPLPPVLPPDQILNSGQVSDTDAHAAGTAIDDADALVAGAGVPVSAQPPVILPAWEGQSFSASAGSPLRRPVLSSIAAHISAAEPQETLAANALAAEAAASPEKSVDMAVSLEAFRAALKEFSSVAADARAAPTSPQAVPGLLAASSIANALTSGQPAVAPTASATVPVPFGQAGWGQAFGNQVVWVVNQGMPAAQLHLSPPDLGPMSVRISMEQDQASMAFSSPHAMVRDAIEAALPRLREMLDSQGITLVDVNVSQHGSAHTQRDPGGDGHAAVSSGRAADREIEATTQRVQGRSIGMLDLYA